jgi:hypothetical protein
MTVKFSGRPENYRQRFLDCKSWGHAWRHTTDFRIVRNTAGDIVQFSRRMTCSHCRTERHDTYDRRMSLTARQYLYPDEYQTSGEQAIVQQTARQEFMRRLLVSEAGGEASNVREMFGS